jgi:hypothetical protein
MKTFLLLILILLNFNIGDELDSSLKVKIKPDSKIIIHGKSNVNKFSCTYYKSLEKDLNLKLNEYSNKINIQGAKISINSEGFECNHKIITKDLKSTINSDKYKHIDIEVKSIYRDKANIEIELSGIKKSYDIPILITDKKVTGLLEINIKDFNLKAPKKILGMVVLDNNIKIELILNYKFL